MDSRNILLESIDPASLAANDSPDNGYKFKTDSRQDPRSPYRKVAFFTTQNRNYKGFITNISRSGAFLVSKFKFTLGQQITLVIPGDKKHGDMKLKGSVVRLSTKGAGVKFDRHGVETDNNLRTSNKRIYAAGDVVKGMGGLTHAAGWVACGVISGSAIATSTICGANASCGMALSGHA